MEMDDVHRPLLARGATEALLGRTDTISALGAKTIGFWGSICLTLNNVMGPAIVAIPHVFRNAGWLTPTLTLLIICCLAGFGATTLCEAMQRIPHNEKFQKRIEFVSVIEFYFGKTAAVWGLIVFNICLQALNIASIIIAAQVLDDFFILVCGKSFALEYTSDGFITSTSSSTDPWSGRAQIISVGFAISALICIPLAKLNLDENMWFQWLSFVLTLLICGVFLIVFWSNGIVRPIETIGEDHTQVIGVVAFSYAFVITVPSWLNERRPGVSVNKVIWYSSIAGLILKFTVGIFGAMAYENVGDNILNTMGDGSQFGKILAFIFNAVVIIPGIPVFSILVRYNLITAELCGPKMAFIYGVVFPWVFAMFFYRGDWFSDFMNWSAILFQGFMNFVVPPALFYRAIQFDEGIVNRFLSPQGQSYVRMLAAKREGGEAVNAIPGWFPVKTKSFLIFSIVLLSTMSIFSIIHAILDAVGAM